MNPLEALNEHFAIVSVGNKMVVMQIDPDAGGSIVELWSFDEFKKLHIKKRVRKQVSSKQTKTVALADEWLQSPTGQQYNRLVYAMPGSYAAAGPKDYNGWRGFTVEPVPGCWQQNREHMRLVLCGGDQVLYDWLFNWCAALVQFPGRHAMSAIVLRGGQGIGKGHFANKMLGALFHKQQYLHMIGANQLTAEFNEHLSGKVLVFADESTWGGDPRHAAKLKGLVTEDNIPIHRKFLKMVEEPSALHIVVASNSDWPVPTDWDDRRFFVLDVSEVRKQDEGYFSALAAELENGGRAAMLADLLAHAIDWAALRHPPETDAKRDLKGRSLGAEEEWLTGWLMDDHGTWTTKQARAVVYAQYEASVRHGRPKSIDGLGKFFKKIFQRAGVVDDWPRGGKVLYASERVNAWEFPPLDDFREIVDRALGTRTDWPANEKAHASQQPTP